MAFVSLFDDGSLHVDQGRINQMTSASAKHRHRPWCACLDNLGTSLHIGFHSPADQFRHRQIAFFGDLLHAMKERFGQLNLRARHGDGNLMVITIRRQIVSSRALWPDAQPLPALIDGKLSQTIPGSAGDHRVGHRIADGFLDRIAH